MADFPYAVNPARIEPFMAKLRETRQPPKVTPKWVGLLGFKSENDRRLIGLLRDLGFTDAARAPTATWQEYRDSAKAKAVMAEAIRGAYEPLFGQYPDAQAADDEALRNVFSADTSVGASTVALMVRTFRSLCRLADFQAGPPAPAAGVVGQGETGGGPAAAGAEPLGPRVMNVTLNVQLQLPATEDSSVYDRLFESMRKHLLSQ